MFKVSTACDMREIDKAAIEEGNIPSIVLMENAAFSCVREITAKFNKKGLKVAVFCGKGNNGGDGFAIARHLSRLCYLVDVFPVCGYDFSVDAETNFNMLDKTDCNIRTTLNSPDIELPLYDFVIDAIFGTGFSGDIKGDAKEIIEYINEYSKYTISIDVPSGLDCDTGKVSNPTVRADMTITLAAYKFGELTYPGADFCGKVIPVDIGIPKIFTNRLLASVIDNEFFVAKMPKRKENTQKGDYGKVLVIAGSLGMTGAAVMAAEAALLSGSGIVTVAAPKECVPIIASKTTEIMTIPLCSEEGHLSKGCIGELLEILPKYDSVIFGPGLGRNEDILHILSAVLNACEVPIVIDADGLYALSKDISMLECCKCGVILTPHEMEMSRLVNCNISEVIENRFLISSEFAENNGITLVLKGAKTIVTSPGGVQYINIKGNPGMATAGSGDTLTGIIAAFAARGINEEDAAACAVYVHSYAGDMCKEKYGLEGVTATRIQKELSFAFKEILR